MAGIQLKGSRAPLSSARRQISLHPWITLLLFLIAWNVVLGFLARPTPSTTVPYSTFHDQVVAGNVTSVDFQGDQLDATLSKAIPWPDQSGAPTYTAVH